ncbi:MAG: histidine phosphatase family protein [Sulfurimonas sp.]|uniref:SixA phosphatase family protein n=1 Tax=Sulfurimonas sp. TaxID=2022749 RepID=UPI00260E046E|nr:histidine phosphatase family protein [Sulfurimonas sp.]MDD5400979.1 histidine phosphatase family protein [Sulfurimonas sp.]
MKKLYIIRHAKSSWKDEALNDFDRPLNKRGKQNAPFMGKRLKENGIMPDIIVSSPALRAKTTAKMIAKEIKYAKDILFNQDIYESSQSTLHKILTKIDDKCGILFLVGHNPALNMLAEYYVDFSQNIPTSGVVEIEFDCDKWADISAKNAKFISFDYPKKYKDTY